MGYLPLLILAVLLLATAEGANREPWCNLYPQGVVDGDFERLGDQINTFYGEETTLLFVLSLYNSADQQAVDISSVPGSIKIDHLNAWSYTIPDQSPDVEIKRAPIKSVLSLKGVGRLERTQDLIRKDVYFSFRGNGPFPATLRPKESLYLLLSVATEKPLPPGDYEIIFTTDFKERAGWTFGTIFRTRRVTDDDSRAQYQKMMADRYRLYGQADQERDALKNLVKIAPGSALSWYYLGRYLEDTGNYEKALKIYRKGLARFPCPVEKMGRDTMLSSEPQPEMVKEGAAWLFRRPCMQQAVANMLKLLKRSE